MKIDFSEALSQVESEALASKVVFPTEREINRAIGDMYDSDIQFLENKCCREQADSYISKGIEWLRSQLTLVPKEQVISPDIDKKEISNDMDNCVCDETHIHNCPVHTHLQNEPEVKAQGLKDWDYDRDEDPLVRDIELDAGHAAPLSSGAACGEFEEWWNTEWCNPWPPNDNPVVKEIARQAFLAGQKSKAATLKLPSKKEFYDKLESITDYIGDDNLPINTDSFYDWLCDAVKSMNEGDGE